MQAQANFLGKYQMTTINNGGAYATFLPRYEKEMFQ